MQREGHEVRTAIDGQQALAAIAEMPPDLVLLDLMMPKRKRLRCLPHAARRPLL